MGECDTGTVTPVSVKERGRGRGAVMPLGNCNAGRNITSELLRERVKIGADDFTLKVNLWN